MENTTSLLFDRSDEKYFVAVNGKAVGPLSAQEVYERVSSNEITLVHFIWEKSWKDWKRIAEDEVFKVLLPQKPSPNAIAQIQAKFKKAPAKPAADDAQKILYLYFNESQYGPFSKTEVEAVLASNKVTGDGFVWAAGWANWKRIGDTPEFAAMLPAAPPAVPSSKKAKGGTKKIEKTKATERRGMPRRPLVARLFLHDDKDVIIAVCRDISIGGMQVLTDRVPGPVGTKIKLNVSPGDPNSVKGFVAEGEIVRVLEDGRGFSFRFSKINEDAKKAIKSYIEAA